MSHPITLTKDNFENEVIKSDKPVLVDFWAEWCGPCRMMGPILEEFAGKHADKIKVAKLDVENADHQSLAEKYGIQSLPTFKVFINGSVVKELIGYRPTEALETDLAEYLK